jgi:Uma2 family endonuclease
MIQIISRPVTFDEFLELYSDEKRRYELHNGVIVEMTTTGEHEEVIGCLLLELNAEIKRLKLPYFTPQTYFVRPPESASGYQPDVIVLNKPALKDEPNWKKSSTISLGQSVAIAIEVVSTNWQDDYMRKIAEYEKIGIPEYWIVDYLGLGGRRFIGNPKQPTLSLYQLVDGEYQVSQLRGDNRIESTAFPELNLTAQQVFDAGIINE